MAMTAATTRKAPIRAMTETGTLITSSETEKLMSSVMEAAGIER
jgi:hypothetical protein